MTIKRVVTEADGVDYLIVSCAPYKEWYYKSMGRNSHLTGFRTNDPYKLRAEIWVVGSKTH